MTALLERARSGKGFGDRPFYGGHLIRLPREGRVWYFRAPGGDSIPKVRAGWPGVPVLTALCRRPAAAPSR